MKINEISNKAAVKIKGLVNSFHHLYDLDFVETEPNVFVYYKEYYSVKIYGSTSVKISIHTIGDKRDKLFTAKQPLQCVREIITEVGKIEKNIELLLELFKRVSNIKDVKIVADKNKGIYILGPNKIKLKMLLWFTSLGPRLICEFPAIFWKTDTEQVSWKSLDAFVSAIEESCKISNVRDQFSLLKDYYPRSIDDDD
jgi:hypothetical protein